MKKRILSFVLCAAMLLSMCLFLGAGVAEDTTADGSTESTESYIPAVNFTNVAPFVQANAQVANGPARAPLLRAVSAAPAVPERVQQDALVTSKTATPVPNSDGTYKIRLESYSTGTVTEKTTTKPTDIVLVLDQSGSMAYDMGSEKVTVYTKVESRNSTNYNNQNNRYVKLSNGEYAKVTITESESGGLFDRTYTYTYMYTDENNKPQRITSEGRYTTFDSWQLYSKETRVLTRLEALQNAATKFAEAVAKKAAGEDGKLGTEDDIDHRIAVVGFASKSGNGNNTELLSISGRNSGSVGVAYNSITPQNLKDVLQSMKTADGQKMVTSAINALAASGATRTDLGMDMAKRILSANPVPAGQERNRVVVVFTDGSPTDDNGFQLNIADSAITTANDIKAANATVYSIGIFSGADATSSGERPSYDYYDDYGGNYTAQQMTNACNWFMQNLSSNNGTVRNPSYYLSAADSDSLNSIFKQISDNISTPSIKLGSKAEVRDIVSPYFTAPANADGITVYAEKAGLDGSGGYSWEKDKAYTDSAKMKAEVKGQAVTVSGFDYDKNFVSQTGRNEANPKEGGDFHGRRLVVEFTVKAKPGFLGGNNVPTNTSDSGVYDENEALVENFEYPRVNVPITTPKLDSKDANVYYGGTVPTAKELCTTGAIGEKMADYVDITYSVDGTTVSNTTDDTYQVTMTVSPKYSGENAKGVVQTAQTETVTSTVNVYKPEVTFKDSIIDYNTTPNYEKDNFVKVEWKHKNDVAADMTGIEPTLTYTYDPAASALTQDTGVKVTVKIGNQDITGAVVFEHEKCSFSNCKYTDDCGYQFYVHINVFDLTIEKKAANGSTIDPNQTFVFKVKNNGTGKTMEVVITGPGEQTIKNLPMGSYTITEDTGWSWKYTPTKDSQTITVNETSATVTFENENKGTNWLTSIAEVINKWSTKDGKATITQEKIWPKN